MYNKIKGGRDLVDDTTQGRSWGAERRAYWKSQGALYEGNINGQISNSGTYEVTVKNVERMLKGKAPIGLDGKSVHLHHTLGKSVDMYTYIEMTRTAHYADFKALHPWMYNK